MITNPRRKKRITEFIDSNRPVMTEFYELTEDRRPSKKLKSEMLQLIKRDPDFYDPYLTLAEVEYYLGNELEGDALVQRAYELAVKRVADCKGDWPKEMAWGWLENRHLMRALDNYAYLAWEKGRAEEALDIFRRLLRANPGDNQGARHSILAIRLGLGPDWEEPFMVTTGPGAGLGLDAAKLGDWFDENAKKFPDEFDWLFLEWKKQGW